MLSIQHSIRCLLLLFAATTLSVSTVFAQEETPAEASEQAIESTETEATASEEEEAMKGASLFERLGQGGVTMVFLALVSIAALTFAIERALNLKKDAINPGGLAEDAKKRWEKGDYEGILKQCEQKPSVLAHVISYLVQHRTCSTLELSAIAGDMAGREMRGHLQKAYPLAIAATIAPLLGLFGTVLGMIDSFEVVAIAGSLGDASILAGGISKALVTTATGLALAMPALAAYHYFKSKTTGHAMALERDINDLLTSWFMEKADKQE